MFHMRWWIFVKMIKISSKLMVELKESYFVALLYYFIGTKHVEMLVGKGCQFRIMNSL